MKVWMITGCSTGLGNSLARVLLERGEKVAVTARNIEDIKELRDAFPDQALILSLDVTDKEAVDQAVCLAFETFGRIDVLVNNAGYGYRAAVEEGQEEDVEKLFATNFFGPVRMIKAVLPYMRSQRGGVIINISSSAVEYTMPGSGYYSASKCALEGLSDGLRREVEPLGIKVMVVEPGAFRTDFAGRSLTQSGKVISDYDSTAGERRIGRDKTDGTQPGDPRKAGMALAEIVEGEDIPFRFVVGADAVEVVEMSLQKRKEELEKWKKYGQQTDF